MHELTQQKAEDPGTNTPRVERRRDPDSIMIPFDGALRLVDESCAGRRVESRRMPVREALGRVLRADQRAGLTLPPFDKATVDGFALPEAAPGAVGDSYRVARVVHAGQDPPGPFTERTAVRVMTGAPLPDGTARVVKIEHTEVSGDRMRILRLEKHPRLCRWGEDTHSGEVVLPAGVTLRPADLATLVSAGITEVEVAARVRLAILSTGDEIVDDPAEIRPGRIMDANGPMLVALAGLPALEPAHVRRVSDDPGATREAIGAALGAADLVLVAGGVSEGDSDFVPAALDALGAETRFTRVAVKPGKPLTFAVHPDGLVLGLPGNPVSAFVMFHLVARRIAAHLAGAAPPGRSLRLRMAAPFCRATSGRLEFVPARLTDDAGVEPVRYHGSGHLAALTAADGIFAVPNGVTDLAAGDEVRFHPVGGRLES